MAQHDSSHVASSQKALMLEMKSLQEQPVEGFKITLVDEADMYNWEVAIFGPPNTHYEGGYFKVRTEQSQNDFMVHPVGKCSLFLQFIKIHAQVTTFLIIKTGNTNSRNHELIAYGSCVEYH